MSEVLVSAPAERAWVVTEADVMERAADLIEEFGHAKGAMARAQNGWACDATNQAAVSFCVSGALVRAYFDLTGQWLSSFRNDPEREFFKNVGRALWKSIDDEAWRENFPPAWNNAPERTAPHVVSKLRQAVINLRAPEGR